MNTGFTEDQDIFIICSFPASTLISSRIASRASQCTSWNLGVFSIGGQVSYGINQGNVQGWSAGQNRYAAATILKADGSDVDESYTLQALFVPGLKFSDTLRFEAGFGYRMDDPQVNNAEKDEQWTAYLQAMITMAQGVFLCPEIGYIDFMPPSRAMKGGWVDPAGLPKGPNGRNVCRWCALEVPKGRRTFCSEWCVHEWRLRTDMGYLREQVIARDKRPKTPATPGVVSSGP